MSVLTKNMGNPDRRRDSSCCQCCNVHTVSVGSRYIVTAERVEGLAYIINHTLRLSGQRSSGLLM